MRVGVLASGTGTNLQALLDAGDLDVAAVASDVPDAPALRRASAAGVATRAFSLAGGEDRAARDARMAAWLREQGAELAVLAGYLRLLAPAFLAAFPAGVINVHPALLPAFPGLHAVEQALAYGVKVFGVTVHFVDEGVDTGPIVLQRAVELTAARTPEDVMAALRPLEHALLPEAVRLIARGTVRRDPEHPRRILVGHYPRPPMSSELVAPGQVRVARALVSVSNKTGVEDFARGLVNLGIEVVSTGGTAGTLAAAGIPVRSIADLTGFPEIMDGRVKTLHPRLYAGILARRDDPTHLEQAAEHGVEWVDLVCVNLYPFESTAARREATDDEVIEDIDIGGPAMIRAAAKNHAFTAPVVTPESYDAVLDELGSSERRLSLVTREWLASEAFAYTARYDTAITRWFAEKGEDFPPLFVRAYEKVLDLSYGENPHQRAAYYAQVGERMHVLSMVRQVSGKQLSFNNLLDLDAARRLGREFSVPACVIVKHNNPCGVAVGEDELAAYRRAFAADPLSAFGGVIAVNRPVGRELAEALVEQFVEVLFAPAYTEAGLEVLSAKPNTRILEDNERRAMSLDEFELKQVVGGLLVQDRDVDLEDRSEMTVVSERAPSEAEWSELLFAWKVCRHVRSNAIVLARDLATAGIGAGQMSRVDSVRLAVEKATGPLAGAALASDAYFPFADGPELAIDAGVRAIIQPGGSVRDPEVIEAADRAGVAMVFTGRRHFRH